MAAEPETLAELDAAIERQESPLGDCQNGELRVDFDAHLKLCLESLDADCLGPRLRSEYRVSESAAGKSLPCKSPGCGEQISVPEIVDDEDDFAGNLGEAAADFGQPFAPVRPRTPRNRRGVAKRERRPLTGRSESVIWPASAGCSESARFSFRI